MMDDFLFKALIGGIGVAVVAAPIGCFLVWRRMAYFGDTMAHSALSGIALGYLLGLAPMVGVFATSVMIAVFLSALQKRKTVTSDTLLGIFSHGALAIGILAITLMEGRRFDIMSTLFGDILAINNTDIITLYSGGGVVLALLLYFWRKLLSFTVNEELAFVEGVPVGFMNLLLLIMLALVVAIAMKIVGILLVTSLMIIPAASIRQLSKTPEQMAIFATFSGIIAVISGIGLAFQLDMPPGPTIVVSALILFIIGQIIPAK